MGEASAARARFGAKAEIAANAKIRLGEKVGRFELALFIIEQACIALTMVAPASVVGR